MPVTSKALSATETAVVEFLARCNVKFSTQLVGATDRDGWKCDEWRVRFIAGRIDTTSEYFTGTGHRVLMKGFRAANMPGATMVHGTWQAGVAKHPEAAGVLSSLLLDGHALDQSFFDWCDEMGADSDSRKALATYEACCESGQRLRKIFSPTQRAELETILQDY